MSGVFTERDFRLLLATPAEQSAANERQAQVMSCVAVAGVYTGHCHSGARVWETMVHQGIADNDDLVLRFCTLVNEGESVARALTYVLLLNLGRQP